MIDDIDVARCLGRIEGELTGINREIKDIKGMLKQQSESCVACRDSINDRFEMDEKRIDGLANIWTGESAVRSWWDSSLTKLGVVGGLILGIAAFIERWF